MKSIMRAAAIAFVAALPTLAGAADAPRGILGYYDPATGTFTPRLVPQPAATTISRAGTIKIIATVTLSSAIPADQPVTCSGGASTYDASYSNDNTTSSSLVRSTGSAGGTGTCTLTIPYNWTLSSAADMVSFSFSLTTGSSYYSTDGVERTSSHTIAQMTVPANNATTTLKVNDSL